MIFTKRFSSFSEYPMKGGDVSVKFDLDDFVAF